MGDDPDAPEPGYIDLVDNQPEAIPKAFPMDQNDYLFALNINDIEVMSNVMSRHCRSSIDLDTTNSHRACTALSRSVLRVRVEAPCPTCPCIDTARMPHTPASMLCQGFRPAPFWARV